jgi:hypothetical protein
MIGPCARGFAEALGSQVEGEEKNAMLLVNASVASAMRSLLSPSSALEPDGQVKKGEVWVVLKSLLSFSKR